VKQKQEKTSKTKEKQGFCPICGEKLHFSYFIVHQDLKIKESGNCKNCSINFATKEFLLH
jgi:transcription elongation factor Elf1